MMTSLFYGKNPKIVEAMQDLRSKGSKSIEILRHLKGTGLDNGVLASNFVSAFNLGLGEHRLIRLWGNVDVPDERVNFYLELAFAQRRIGNKGLTPENVASYLGLSVLGLMDYIQSNNKSGLLIPSEWRSSDGSMHSSVIIPPDMLFELEEKFLDGGSRANWWSW